jgi:hypothetical protein
VVVANGGTQVPEALTAGVLVALAVLVALPRHARPATPVTRPAQPPSRSPRARIWPSTRWARRPRRSAPAPPGTSIPVTLDLVAAVLAAGATPAAALGVVAGALDRRGDGELARQLRSAVIPGDRHVPALTPLLLALDLAASTGLAPAALVRSAAADQRRVRSARQARAARRAAVVLVLPLGLCQLPAFVLLGVVPLVLALLPGA